MSGVGEASAIFGLVTGSIDLIKTAIDICQAADGNAPKRIKGVADQLPSIEQLLENARDTKDKQNDVWKGVAEDVKRCEAACRALKDIFDQACPREGSSRGRRVWNASAVIFTGKRTKAEEHLAVILKTLGVFKAKLIITNTKLLEDLKSAIDAFDREDGGSNHYGSGDGFWTSGGTVNVPKGGTNHFISSIGTYENKNYYGNLVLPSGSQAASAPYHEEARPKKGIEILPWPRDSRFIGREDTLKDIQKTLEEEGSVALTGPGGVGKSQVALEYVWRFRKSEPQAHVLWIYAGSVDTFDKEYRRLAAKLKLVLPGEDVDNDQMRDRVKDWLNDSENGRWLMVIDNADSHDVFFAVDELDTGVGIANALPWHRPGDAMILYTSRHADIGQKLADFNTLRLEPLSSEDSEELLRNLSGSTVSADLSQEQARRLLEALEYLPLSISHAAGWLRKKRSTVDEYLAFLEQSDDSLLDILSQDMAVGPMDRRHQSAPKSVVKAWLVTFNLLEKHDPAAANLFCLAACLDRHSISLDNFEKAIDVQAPRGWRIGKIMDLPFPVTQADLLSAVGELEDLALLRRGVGDQSFSMHRYVQAITINQLEQREILKSYYSLAFQSVLHMEEQVALLRYTYRHTYPKEANERERQALQNMARTLYFLRCLAYQLSDKVEPKQRWAILLSGFLPFESFYERAAMYHRRNDHRLSRRFGFGPIESLLVKAERAYRQMETWRSLEKEARSSHLGMIFSAERLLRDIYDYICYLDPDHQFWNVLTDELAAKYAVAVLLSTSLDASIKACQAMSSMDQVISKVEEGVQTSLEITRTLMDVIPWQKGRSFNDKRLFILFRSFMTSARFLEDKESVKHLLDSPWFQKMSKICIDLLASFGLSMGPIVRDIINFLLMIEDTHRLPVSIYAKMLRKRQADNAPQDEIETIKRLFSNVLQITAKRERQLRATGYYYATTSLVKHAAICDTCDRSIQEIRYKCLECHDHDSCADCLPVYTSPDGGPLLEVHHFLPIYSEYPVHPRLANVMIGKPHTYSSAADDHLIDRDSVQSHDVTAAGNWHMVVTNARTNANCGFESEPEESRKTRTRFYFRHVRAGSAEIDTWKLRRTRSLKEREAKRHALACPRITTDIFKTDRQTQWKEHLEASQWLPSKKEIYNDMKKKKFDAIQWADTILDMDKLKTTEPSTTPEVYEKLFQVFYRRD